MAFHKFQWIPDDAVSLTTTRGNKVNDEKLEVSLAEKLNDAWIMGCDNQLFAGKLRLRVSDINED